MGTFGQGTYIEKRMFESRAFLALQGSALQVLVLFLGKRIFERVGKKESKKKVCVNCDSITFTYIEAHKKYGFTKQRFLRAIDDLLAKGFIEVKHQGGGYKQDKSIYALSVKWTFWNPGTVFEQRKRDPVQRGFLRPKRNIADGLQDVAN
jgi:hypothetical protein